MGHHNDQFENFNFYVLPSNTSGSVSIPITLSPTPTPLASVTLRTDCECRCATVLSATVGWVAVTNGIGLGRVDVLFRIWRGLPSAGTFIFSAVDSGQSILDPNQVTSFTHVDTHVGSRPHTYVLTAELLNTGGAATVIGPITFVASELER